ncbi:DUF937 domain-containing protein [Corynebacterium sp.]|uniref:DUF937 domain-containing protein n=1 Tax=Corynebacterium sp. TaxID=1720 RepID=UPI003736C0F7
MTKNANAIQELLSKLPYDELSKKTGEDPHTVRTAAEGIFNSLLMGMGANAEDDAGRDSLTDAVQQHDPKLAEGDVSVADIDTEDGDKIAAHIFGQNKDHVTQQLGGAFGGSNLVRQLLPLLAPVALSWLSGRLQQSSESTESAGSARNQGGLLQQILQQMVGSQPQQSTQGEPSEQSMGTVLKDLLGGLLGGGRR